MPIPPNISERLAKVAGLLGSSHDGERATGDPAHYQQAVGMTLGYGRLLLIETTGALASAWLGVLPRPTPDRPLLLVLPSPGDMHPRLPRGQVVQ